MATPDLIDYDRTAADYEASLVTKLRGHGAGSFLENWVPDPDPVLGIFNMIEAAWTGEQSALALSVSRTTLDAGALERLKELSKAVARIDVRQSGEAYRLDITRITASRSASESRHARRAAKTQSPATAAAPRTPLEAARPLHPALEQALLAETASFTHEKGAKEGISFTVDAGGLISEARHSGVKPELRRRLAELMCRVIEGRTVQDASDHAAVLAIHRLELRAGKRPSQGILLPANAGTEVQAALEMVRSACRAELAKSSSGTKANFFDPGPGPAWSALAVADKLRRIVEAADAFCRKQGGSPTAIKPVRIDKDIHGHEIRVIVQLDGTIPADGVPFALRRLERSLKAGIEETLQVYLEPVKDKNVLRRL